MIKKDIDTLILEELRTHEIKGLTTRGKIAVRELAELNEGAVIFLILSLNSRIRDLEEFISYEYSKSTVH